MGQPTPTSNPMVRRAANSVMLLLLISTGITLSLLLAGQRELAWQVCAGFAVLTLAILAVGAALVAKSR